LTGGDNRLTVGSLFGPLLLLPRDRLASTDRLKLLPPVLERLRDDREQSSDDVEQS